MWNALILSIFAVWFSYYKAINSALVNDICIRVKYNVTLIDVCCLGKFNAHVIKHKVTPPWIFNI